MGVPMEVKITLNGEEVLLYPISKLASELGRTADTIRKWEISGVLPRPVFKDKHGRRLYTQEQIDTIVECAMDCKVRRGYSIANTNFSPKVHEALEKVNSKYL